MTRELPDLASRLLGGSVVAANDEFFAARDHLIEPAPPAAPVTFGPKGTVYDGWETRRRREPGHDHAIIRLGLPGVIRRVVVDTSHFTGNYPPHASVEACGVSGYPDPAELSGADWVEIVPRSPLAGDRECGFGVELPVRFTHVRLAIYPDGGVARLRVLGEPVPDPRWWAGTPLDLAALEQGAAVVGCSNEFYGSPGNLILPGPAATMGEGWETARRRDRGHDWVSVRLAVPGRVRVAELDTSHFKGNAPAAAMLRGVDGRESPVDRPDGWFVLLPRTRLQPDTRHRFRVDAATEGGAAAATRPATHVRLSVYPDGGMARLRLYGEPTPDGLAAAWLRWFNLLPAGQARDLLVTEGGLAEPQAGTLVAVRPLHDLAALPAALRPSEHRNL